MTSSELDNLVRIGRLKVEPPSRVEFEGLLKAGRAKLADAKKKTLSLDSRFDLAYGAAHAFSLAALRAVGYRSENRTVVFQVLPYTLGTPMEYVRTLAKAHTVRNAAEYEGYLDADDRLVADVIAGQR
ncbi:MAG: hypothetical protein U0133_11875 [Gemmatimonadales bacterium]